MRFFLAPLALALAACATAPARPDAARALDACAYYPLAVGNRWIYDGPQGPGGKIEPVTVTITRQADGFFQDDKGGALRCTAEGLQDGKRYLLKAPAELGATWTNVVSISSTEHYAITAVGKPLTTPAGTFDDTITVVARNAIDAKTTLVNETTFARGVGIVRLQTRVLQGEKEIPQVTAVLRAFQPAPAAAAAP